MLSDSDYEVSCKEASLHMIVETLRSSGDFVFPYVQPGPQEFGDCILPAINSINRIQPKYRKMHPDCIWIENRSGWLRSNVKDLLINFDFD